MLSWLKTNAALAREKLTTEVAKFKNKEFMEAVANSCAMVAAADGEVSSAEKMKMTGFINNSPELKVFNLSDVIKVFNDACGKFEFDFQIGQAEALKTSARSRVRTAQVACWSVLPAPSARRTVISTKKKKPFAA